MEVSELGLTGGQLESGLKGREMLADEIGLLASHIASSIFLFLALADVRSIFAIGEAVT